MRRALALLMMGLILCACATIYFGHTGIWAADMDSRAAGTYVGPSQIFLEHRRFRAVAGAEGEVRQGRVTPEPTQPPPPPPQPPPTPPTKPCRILFYIMVSGWREMEGVENILDVLYHADHFYLIHMDKKAANPARTHLSTFNQKIMRERGDGRINIHLVDPPMSVNWGGFSMTLSAVYGIAQALHWSRDWDYFVNLSGSDLPLLRAEEMAHTLQNFTVSNTSFIQGFMYEPSWEGYKYIDRRTMYVDDVALMVPISGERQWPWPIGNDQETVSRPLPERFTVHKGEFWVLLHRSMCEYIHYSPDNQARTLLAYFSGVLVSDEEFFQTVACNPLIPDTMQIHNDGLRFVNWWDDDASPSVMNVPRAVAAANSGALFGRKFSTKQGMEGVEGVAWIKTYLNDTGRAEARMERLRRRLAMRTDAAGNSIGFCYELLDKYNAVPIISGEGVREKVPPPRPPVRIAGANLSALFSALGAAGNSRPIPQKLLPGTDAEPGARPEGAGDGAGADAAVGAGGAGGGDTASFASGTSGGIAGGRDGADAAAAGVVHMSPGPGQLGGGEGGGGGDGAGGGKGGGGGGLANGRVQALENARAALEMARAARGVAAAAAAAAGGGGGGDAVASGGQSGGAAGPSVPQPEALQDGHGQGFPGRAAEAAGEPEAPGGRPSQYKFRILGGPGSRWASWQSGVQEHGDSSYVPEHADPYFASSSAAA